MVSSFYSGLNFVIFLNYLIFHVYLNMFLVFLAPSSPPLGIQLEQTDAPGELRVRWLPPPADTHNGLIIGYRLRAVPQLNGIKGIAALCT